MCEKKLNAQSWMLGCLSNHTDAVPQRWTEPYHVIFVRKNPTLSKISIFVQKQPSPIPIPTLIDIDSTTQSRKFIIVIMMKIDLCSRQPYVHVTNQTVKFCKRRIHSLVFLQKIFFVLV